MSDEATTRHSWFAGVSGVLLVLAGMVYNVTIAPLDNKVDALNQQYIELTKKVSELQVGNAKANLNIEHIKDTLARMEQRKAEAPQ